jgi:hypothetical protein
MDLYKVIRDLHKELERNNQVIAALEELMRNGSPTIVRHRGRPMAEGERRAVSERMKRYWASRREQRS